MIITKTLIIQPLGNSNYWKGLGYKFENKYSFIEVKVEDLSNGSKIIIECVCDVCESKKNIPYRTYFNNFNNSNFYACSVKCAKNKVKATTMLKYGVDNISKLSEYRDKAKQTMIERYGVEHTFQSEELKDKSKNTILAKYGVENISQSTEIQNKKRENHILKYGVSCAFNREDIQDKIKITLLKKYGDKHFSQIDEIKEKIKRTNLEKYGQEYYLQTQECDDRKRKSYHEKYGVDWVSKSKEIKNKKKITCLEKYDVENQLLSPEIISKIKKTNLEKYGVDNIFKSKDLTSIFKIKAKNTKEINLINKYKLLISDKYEIIKYNSSTFTINHSKCNNIFDINIHLINDRLKYNSTIEICTTCNPISSFSTSSHVNDISQYLNYLNIDHKLNDRTILKGKELDIYIPSHNLAIEFNGLYLHSEFFKDKNYHLNKTLLCQEQEIQLLHIFEDDWIYKQEIVKSIILNKLGLIQNKIYARKCLIKEVKPSDAMIFLEKNHIQGSCKSKFKIGLYFEDELVSLMTFGYRKTNTKKEFELIRFCNKLNINVIGASSKLFKFFIKNYKIEESYLISYSDLSLFDGKMYETLGFDRIHLSKPNYFWVVGDKREHRFKFNKQKLIKDGFDASKTEIQIMHDRKYYRIWGCGQVRWEYNI